MYSPLVRANPLGNRIKGKGIRVNTKNQWADTDEDLPESKQGNASNGDSSLVAPSTYNSEVMLNQESVHVFIARRSLLTQREAEEPKLEDSSQFFKHEEVRLATDSGREELVRMYFMCEVPKEYHEMKLVFKDSFVGMLYMEVIFTSRGEKEAFYNTHRMIRGISRLSINEALRRLESLNLPNNQSWSD